MATDIRALPAFLGDDATFRTWGSGISAQLLAMGLVKTSDTGQIDFVTVSRPAVNVFAGYEIWRFADALQATKPIFIKLEYGIGTVADRPAWAVTVGNATNGAGTLIGQVGTRTTFAATASKTVGLTLNSYCSGSTSRLSLVSNLDPTTATFHGTVLVERPCNAAGVSTGEGIVTFIGATTSGVYQFIPFTGSIPAAVSSLPAIAGNSGGLSLMGLDVALSPSLIFCGMLRQATFLSYFQVDIGELFTFTATHLSATRTFMPIGDGGPTTRSIQTSIAGYALAILWE